MLRKELDELEKSSNGRLKVYVSRLLPAAPRLLLTSNGFDAQHVLNNPPVKWSQGRGFITRQMIEDFMPHDGVGAPKGGSKVLLCGPPPMINAMKWVSTANLVDRADAARIAGATSRRLATRRRTRSPSSRTRSSASERSGASAAKA